MHFPAAESACGGCAGGAAGFGFGGGQSTGGAGSFGAGPAASGGFAAKFGGGSKAPVTTFFLKTLPFIVTPLPFIVTPLPFIVTPLPFVVTPLPFIVTPLPFIVTTLPFFSKAASTGWPMDDVSNVPAKLAAAADGSRRRDCHFADAPSPSLLERLLNGEGRVQQNDSLADG